MTNYFYCDKIAEQIRTLLDKELPVECARNISTGDFGILPEPSHLIEYLPAVLIRNTDVVVHDVNAALEIVLTENKYEIMYLYPYTFSEMQDVPAQAKRNLQMIANVLMRHRTLDGFGMSPSEEEAGGILLSGKVDQLHFDSAETKLFRTIDVPMAVGVIDYIAEFRTYQSGVRR